MISEEGIKKIKAINNTFSRDFIIETDRDFTAAVSRLKCSRVNLNIPIVPVTKERKAQKAIL